MSKFDKPKLKKPKFDNRLNKSKSLLSEAELPPIELDETIIAGRRPKPLNSLERLLMEIPEFNSIEPEMLTGRDGIIHFNIKEFDQKIAKILHSKSIDVGIENLVRYLAYLKKNLQLPCNVTGRQDFPWEEEYVIDSGNKKEYQKLKKSQPSYTDIFEIKQFKDSVYHDEGILVEVKRLSDHKEFVLPLVDLVTSDEDSQNNEFLDDYSTWFINH
ncbi:hypothetical protein CP500_002215 [Tychonema bourrellyi FEM_GT703]|uniref:Uncharacterized protein n=1 Tax=Tychonema bourrellyi FEM_GT703 TaxID=2040638 RepID=A0A2G4F5G1_9CYAN|nr:calcium-binding protein [Tychonema bourrellyi]PHX57024.1 hypothetical protein CP500_002215 [Tychonema bourrellyi FEM_GT703]